MEVTSRFGGGGFKSFLKLNASSKRNRNLTCALRIKKSLGSEKYTGSSQLLGYKL